MALAVLAFVRTGWVALLAIAVAVAAVPVVGWIAAFLSARRVELTLESVSSVPKGRPAALKVALENRSRLPIPCAEARVAAHNLLTDETALIDVRLAAAPRGRVEGLVELESELCGRMDCRIERARLFDPLRILARKAPCGAERRFTVVPTLHDSRLRDIYAAAPLSDTTVFSPYLRGSDLSEPFGLREYEPGDEIRRIHWKLSEKTDQLVVRDPSLPLDNSLLLFWDKSLPERLGAAPLRADTMAEVVLALMEQLARAGVAFEAACSEPRSGRCSRTFVTEENDIYELVGHLLSSPCAPAPESGLDSYLRLYGTLGCSRLIYVCAQRPFGLADATAGRDVLLLMCDEPVPGGEGAEGAASAGQGVVRAHDAIEVHFAPGEAAEALTMAGAM